MRGHDQLVLPALMNSDPKLVAALAEQERLRRELHHRVANTLQILASIVSMLGRDADTQAARDIHAGIEMHIQAIALVQRWLPDSCPGHPIDAEGLIADLCALLQTALSTPDAPKARISYVIPSLALDLDHAMPVALLITAAAIHASMRGQSDPLAMAITASSEAGIVHIDIQSVDLGTAAAGSPVPRLVAAMVSQLQGTLVHDGVGGRWTISFAATPG